MDLRWQSPRRQLPTMAIVDNNNDEIGFNKRKIAKDIRCMCACEPPSTVYSIVKDYTQTHTHTTTSDTHIVCEICLFLFINDTQYFIIASKWIDKHIIVCVYICG